VSAGSAIYLSILRRKLDKIEGYDGASIPNSQLTNDVGSLKNIMPIEVRTQVIDAYASSISTIWLVCTPLVFVGFLMVLLVRPYSLKRAVQRGPIKPTPGDTSPQGDGVPTDAAAGQDEEKAEPGEVDDVAIEGEKEPLSSLEEGEGPSRAGSQETPGATAIGHSNFEK